MSFFNIFSTNNLNKNNAELTMPQVTNQFSETAQNPVVEIPSVPHVPTMEEKITKRPETLTVTYASGWPIDIIYGYLHKNYEEKGFNDAIRGSDIVFMENYKTIIRNEILMTFKQVNLKYDILIYDIESQMDQLRSAGLLFYLASLERQMKIVESHKQELKKLEENFRNNANETSVPIQSYECGFLRGIAEVSLAKLPFSINTTEKVEDEDLENDKYAKVV